ncbi:hypothetical protein CYQ27_04095 [Enterococcus faecalis]|nr:hypothetical protein [Enterococcus faecalis]MBO6372960.1 hypothetical protein [Enterococcus faecalis]PQD11476.1 hypothetical protein CUM65_04040 [Enterococcus faecalis]PQG37170.1 hypothetical protein CUS34_10805 [Enterococcus faecalis]RXV23843.1 hypothetical protein CYQ36_02025 [Enterococcus faecalis]RXV25055.1 hypothetical protein CYQ38_02620 [Enterococcus faecalis]
MMFNQEAIEIILERKSSGLKVDELLKELHVEETNNNRICLVSILQWNPKILHSYLLDNSGHIVNVYKLKRECINNYIVTSFKKNSNK